ncbi:MAG: winged helix-turn-helix domain-containing protein [Eubacterium sp.]|nr:winged helix-turn-helix domain-containing protein [Eubacterium sp.]
MTELKEPNPFFASFFGNFELKRDNVSLNELDLRSRQATKLLAILIYHYRDPYPSAKLIDMLWPGTAENPTHALSNLIYRLRKSLAKVWPGEKLIVLRNGCYQWNPDIPIITDVRELDSCVESLNEGKNAPEDITRIEQLLRNIKGKFLADFSDDIDVLSVQTYYHNLFLKSFTKLIQYYESEHLYSAMELLCQSAIHVDPLEEQFHCGMLQALIGSNRFLAAEDYYHEIISQMKSYMGDMHTERIEEIYQRMQKRIHFRETDIDRIMGDMKEEEQAKHAYVCEYGFFQKMFTIQLRLKKRDNIPVSIVLLSLYVNGGELTREMSDPVMGKLEEILLSSLRQGDIISKYSPSQYITMLGGCSREQTEVIMQRICAEFYRKNRNNKFILQYSARQLSDPMLLPAPACS